MSAAHVVIVGGGLAGMAAAGALAKQGLAVTLLESRPRWGGRASSFVDQATGEVIDNCQHVILGCCNAFRHLVEEAGCGHWLRPEPTLWFIGPGRTVHRLSASPLPAPLHLAPSFARFSYLSERDKLRLAFALKRLARAPEPQEGESFHDWLIRHRQSPELIERFWNVVLVSALSETLDRIDVGHARKVFVDGFLRNRDGWQMWVPSVSLDQFYGEGLCGWLERLGVRLQPRSGVRNVLLSEDRVTGVELRSGERLMADHVVLAVPHHLVLEMLPETLARSSALKGIGQLADAPIASVHLWFDDRVVPLPHAVLVGRFSQWVFDRSAREASGSPGKPGQYLQVVISAARDMPPQAEVIRKVTGELAEIWPAVGGASLRHARVVTEHRAAMSVVPGVDRLRPVQQSPVANLQLAGDWTQTGWPSTMEGAVRSGLLAAENILRHLGQPASLLPPELPTAWLSRMLLGLPGERTASAR